MCTNRPAWLSSCRKCLIYAHVSVRGLAPVTCISCLLAPSFSVFCFLDLLVSCQVIQMLILHNPAAFPLRTHLFSHMCSPDLSVCIMAILPTVSMPRIGFLRMAALFPLILRSLSVTPYSSHILLRLSLIVKHASPSAMFLHVPVFFRPSWFRHWRVSYNANSFMHNMALGHRFFLFLFT